jgi:two-component system, NarL family, nitrate/nitrite response regulator NarL
MPAYSGAEHAGPWAMDEIGAALRVVVVADDPLARAGLVALLADQPGVVVAGGLSTAALAPGRDDFPRADVVVWDLGWATDEASARMAAASEVAPIVALVPDEPTAVDAWSAGARGLLRRDAEVDAVTIAVHAVSRGLVVHDPRLTDVVLATRGPTSAPLAEDLTPREQDVLALLAEGLPNKAIAARLAISEHTVKFHVNAILGKMGAQSRTEAVMRAARLGLVHL